MSGISIFVGIAALIGAISGSASLALSIANFVRDRAKLDIVLSTGMKAINAPEYDENKPYTTVNVYNTGRRPIYFFGVSLVAPGLRHFAVLSDSIRRSADTYVLEEASPPMTFLVDEELLENDYGAVWPVMAAETTDHTGKRWRSKRLKMQPKWGHSLTRRQKFFLYIRWRLWLLRRSLM